MLVRTVSSYVVLRRGAFSRLYFGAGPVGSAAFLPPALAFAFSARSFFFASAAALASASWLSSFAMTLHSSLRELGSRLHTDADLLVAFGNGLGTGAAVRLAVEQRHVGD